jgi:hypothetical protein
LLLGDVHFPHAYVGQPLERGEFAEYVWRVSTEPRILKWTATASMDVYSGFGPCVLSNV